MPQDTRPGDVLADRYRLSDLLAESAGGRFWRAFDNVLQRDVAVHILPDSDERAPLLREAARTSATVLDRRMLRVLDIDEADDHCFVVNEWGSGTSLDILLAGGEPLAPAVAAWIVAEVADTIALAHSEGVAHGRLVPENVLIDQDGAVRLIGFAVDAALHGLPAGRTRNDVVDLVGLLYAGLTGKWAGVSRSTVPRAPSMHGHVLRPRQVRAGIPRALDSLCDHVLNRGAETSGNGQHPPVTADMVSDALRAFLGDAARAAETWLARIDHSQQGVGLVVLPALPDPPVREPDFEHDARPADRAPELAGEGDSHDPVGTDGADSADSADEGFATQAGMPIFHDDSGDVSWLRQRSEKAAPPPPFDSPPPRPLFAPDPAEGQPARRPRVVTTEGGSPEGYWPWDTGTGAGSGFLPPVDDDQYDGEPGTPGANMLRLAAIVGACLLLLLASVIAFNLGRGRTLLGGTTDTSEPSSRTSSGSTSSTGGPSGSATPRPLTGLTARDFDPQGDPPEEDRAEAPLVVDGDASTTWSTSTYTQDFGPGGLKTGVGVVLDLGAAKKVSSVDLTLVGSPTDVQVYVARKNPATLQGLTAAGSTTVSGTKGTVTLSDPVTGRYVVVWLTSLPAVSGGYRGTIAEAVVQGD